MPECLRGVQRPVRVAQQLAREQHGVGVAVGDDPSACSGSVISPTAPVADAGLVANARANGTW